MADVNDRTYDTDLLDALSKPTPSRRNTFGCTLVNPGDDDIAARICELSLEGTAIAKRVVVDCGDELGVETSIW